MRHATDVGMNKTGIGMAKKMGEQMAHSAQESVPSSAGDEHALNQLRQDYINDAPPVGTTPPPDSVMGMAKMGVQMLRGRRPSVFVDKLGERLAFERTGVRLYEALLTKHDALGSWKGGPTREHLIAFHEDKRKHFESVRDAIESLGGDPTVITPAADIAGVASMGLVQVITDPRTSLAEALSALLIAELTDNAGWQLLIHLAEGLGQDEIATRFRVALAEEETHLTAVRRWISVEADQEAQGGVEARPPIH